MLVDAFEKLQKNGFVRLLQQYFSSVAHMAVVAILALVSALFALEIPVFYCFLVLSLLVLFFGKDITGMLPILGCGYMSISYSNNPQAFPETSALFQPEFLIQAGYCVGVILFLTVVRMIYMLVFGGKKGSPRLWIGFAALAAAYLLGGIFTPYFSAESVAVGLLEIAAIGALYFIVRYAIDWERFHGDYIFKLLIVFGALVFCQIIAMYFREGVVVDGTVANRGLLGTGWGHYNAVGCIMAMCSVAPLYFAATKKHGWLFTALAFVFLGGVVLTQSRGSILFGGCVFVVALVVMLIKSKKRERIFNAIVLGAFCVVGLVVALCFFEKLQALFASMLQQGTSDNGRKPLYETAWKHFLSAPVFGVGWVGPSEDFMWPAMLPRFSAHNTALQILGSLGLVGACAYLFHRFQTVLLVFRRPSAVKTFLALSVCVMLAICFMDCHFFQCGPSALMYSVSFAIMEGTDIKAGVDTRLRLKRKKEIA